MCNYFAIGEISKVREGVRKAIWAFTGSDIESREIRKVIKSLERTDKKLEILQKTIRNT